MPTKKSPSPNAKGIAADTIAFQRLMEIQVQAMDLLKEVRRTGLHVQVAVQDEFPVFIVGRCARRMPQHPRSISPRVKPCGCRVNVDCDCDDDDEV